MNNTIKHLPNGDFETLTVKTMNLIPLDYSRCNNVGCTNKTICKRFLQMAIDKDNPGVKPPSVCSFDEKGCERLLRK